MMLNFQILQELKMAPYCTTTSYGIHYSRAHLFKAQTTLFKQTIPNFYLESEYLTKSVHVITTLKLREEQSFSCLLSNSYQLPWWVYHICSNNQFSHQHSFYTISNPRKISSNMFPTIKYNLTCLAITVKFL